MITKNELQNYLTNGGATLSASGVAVDFPRGYQVSFFDGPQVAADDLAAVLTAVNDFLSKCPASAFVGLWLDSGRVCVDYSEHVERMRDALVLGVERAQMGVWDWALKRTIKLKD